MNNQKNLNQKSEDIYDIKKYTDNELLQILDLANMNPTDRELEAKIIYYIKKYNFIPTENAKKLAQFFNDIYDHFFEEEEDREESTKTTTIEGFSTPSSINQTTPTTSTPSYSSVDIGFKPSEAVGLTKPVSVSRDKMNPVLNQTITRVISIDSQFRDNLNNKITTLSTDFTFDLSEPLRDVVSLKLYSIQLPYTWYTIDSAFGSNFFILEPNPKSLINGNYNFYFDISAGNYTNTTIFTALNNSVTNLINQFPDVSFGTTNFNFNPVTAITTMTFDIQNIYNEPQYQLVFDGSHNPFNQFDATNSVANFLGYSFQSYNTSTIYGQYNPASSDVSSNQPNYNSTYNFNNDTTTPYYYVDACNNYFTIIQYVATPTTLDINTKPTVIIPDIVYQNDCPLYNDISSNIPSVVLNQWTISFSNQIQFDMSYSRQTLLNDLNNQIKNLNSHNNFYSFLDIPNSGASLTGITDPSCSFNINDVSYVQLDLKLSRYTTPNIYNYKTVVQFPNENEKPPPNGSRYLWRDFSNNGTSCFNFDPKKTFFELNDITGEDTPAITNYKITKNPYILLRCIRQQYDFSLNDYVIKLENSDASQNALGGYTLSQYLQKINKGINYANKNSISLNNNDLNLLYPGGIDLSDNEIPDGINGNPLIRWKTQCYQNPSDFKIKFQFDITRTYTADKYLIDISNTILQTVLGIELLNNSSDISYNNSHFTCSFQPLPNGYYVPFHLPVIKFLLKDQYTGSPINYIRYDVFMDASGSESTVIKYYENPTDILTDMNTAFNNFIFYYRRYSGPNQSPSVIADVSDNPIKGTYLNPLRFTGGNFQTILDVSINVPLKTDDYQVIFYDASGNNYNSGGNYDSSGNVILSPWSPTGSWATNLYMTDQSYNLIDPYFADISGNLSTISSSRYVLQDEIIFSNGNNLTTAVLQFNPIPSANGLYGLYQDQGDNIIKIDLSSNYPYQREILINDLNTRLSQNPLTQGSYFFIEYKGSLKKTRLRLNINKIYTANDYNLVFYNNIDFVKCYVGATSVRNVSWDSTLGWILGFRAQTTYPLSSYYTSNIPSGIASLLGDSTVALNLYNYFMIILDDFNQNHLNDGLVTITKKDYSIYSSSYTARSSNICNNPDSSSNLLTMTNNSIIQNFNGNNSQTNLTQNQIYSNNQLLNANQTNNTLVQTSPGPYIKDIFGLIPLKTTGLSPGQPYIEFGGTLQAQERIYFGPVNIHRMHIQLINDHGNVVNLNGQNWSFSLLCEQLYQSKAT